MEFLYPIIMTAVIIGSLVFVYKRQKSGKPAKSYLLAQIACFFVVGFVGLGLALTGSAAAETAPAASNVEGISVGIGFIAAALAVGMSGIGGGIAVSATATAALGAISENESIFGKSLIMVALAEGISLWGMIIAFIILGKI